ncbi:DMT family transporter [Polymorphospora rubra]|uniref:Membrane protein n=1 Tax=Polymorphospora rubra TaxID=338584 RepID=A0A810N4K6_9ACTN|nr:membrane protein [Polymorphospora rubra]
MTATEPGTAPTPTVPSSRRAVGVAFGVVAGVALAAQSRVNGELGVRLHDGIAAAVVSFGSGLLILAVLTATVPAARRGMRTLRTALRDGGLRPWQCLGGVCGAFLVATQGLTVATLGVAVFIVAVVAGQSTSSLAVDRAGFGPAGRQPVTASRLAGAVLTVLAVLLAVSDRLGSPSTLALALLPALAGMGIAWQQAVNGHVKIASGSAIAASFVNFVTGTAALLFAFVVVVAVRGWPDGQWPTEPWLYTGGVIGTFFIAVAAVVVQYTGVLLLSLSMIAGQVGGALLFDVLVPPPTGRPGVTTIVGAALTLVAVLVAAGIRGLRPRRRAG